MLLSNYFFIISVLVRIYCLVTQHRLPHIPLSMTQRMIVLNFHIPTELIVSHLVFTQLIVLCDCLFSGSVAFRFSQIL